MSALQILCLLNVALVSMGGDERKKIYRIV